MDDIQVGFQKLFGHPLEPLTPPQALALLKLSRQDLLLILVWNKEMPSHQLVLHEIGPDERVLFYNPFREKELPPGSKLTDPERRVEADGMESVSFDVFRSLFTERQARCFDTRQRPS